MWLRPALKWMLHSGGEMAASWEELLPPHLQLQLHFLATLPVVLNFQSFQFLHVFYRINHAVDFINLPIMDIKFLQPLSKPDFSIFR